MYKTCCTASMVALVGTQDLTLCGSCRNNPSTEPQLTLQRLESVRAKPFKLLTVKLRDQRKPSRDNSLSTAICGHQILFHLLAHLEFVVTKLDRIDCLHEVSEMVHYCQLNEDDRQKTKNGDKNGNASTYRLSTKSPLLKKELQILGPPSLPARPIS